MTANEPRGRYRFCYRCDSSRCGEVVTEAVSEPDSGLVRAGPRRRPVTTVTTVTLEKQRSRERRGKARFPLVAMTAMERVHAPSAARVGRNLGSSGPPSKREEPTPPSGCDTGIRERVCRVQIVLIVGILRDARKDSFPSFLGNGREPQMNTTRLCFQRA